MSIAILFPGQGSQKPGMGRDVAERFDWAMDLWVLAEQFSGLELREIYWQGEPADMADTRALQPALATVNMTLWMAAARNMELSPMAVAGHSLGEYPALAAAGVLSPEDTLRATALRGRLMAECGGEDHAMAAVVKLPQEQVETMAREAAEATGTTLVVANYNSPAQFVVSGERAALDDLAEQVKQAKGRAIPLAVSGAFHSPLMREAADEFSGLLAGLDWRAPSIPVYFDATAATAGDPEAIRDIMISQMTSAVHWVQIMSNLYAAGARTFVECGPGNVLARLAGQNLSGMDDVQTVGVDSAEAAAAL